MPPANGELQINTPPSQKRRHSRSKKWRFAFQTFTESPAATPSILGFGITHQPHEGGDGAKCGAKFADTPHVIRVKVTGVRSK